MKLYLVQHGDALPKEENPDRPLSEQGTTDMQRVAALLADAGIQIAQAFHSGKTRAKQTAELLAETLLPQGSPKAIEGLKPNDPVQAFEDAIAGWYQDTLVVGHLPFMAKAASQLLAGNEEIAAIAFRPGTIVCLEKEKKEDSWRLVWMLRPELIR